MVGSISDRTLTVFCKMLTGVKRLFIIEGVVGV